MQVLFLVSFFAAVQATVVPPVDTQGHFHFSAPNALQPQGKNVTINGVLTYVSLPKKKFDPSVAVLLLTNVFGLPSPDNLLLVRSRALNMLHAITAPCQGGRMGCSGFPGIMKAQSHVPIEINNAELDTGFTSVVAVETDGVMGDGKYLPGYFRKQFDGVGHGFAVRANASDPVQVAAKQGAFDTSLSWFQSHLKK
ncbi:hypothetical protein B0H12DRAFT_1228210 [Mycena haematopus]|nr:hypothetical protein B0H12DRAFT_1228210 [Mycena haematopus]